MAWGAKTLYDSMLYSSWLGSWEQMFWNSSKKTNDPLPEGLDEKMAPVGFINRNPIRNNGIQLISAWRNGWVNNPEIGGLRRHRAHYDVTVMQLMKYWYVDYIGQLGILVFKTVTLTNHNAKRLGISRIRVLSFFVYTFVYFLLFTLFCHMGATQALICPPHKTIIWLCTYISSIYHMDLMWDIKYLIWFDPIEGNGMLKGCYWYYRCLRSTWATTIMISI